MNVVNLFIIKALEAAQPNKLKELEVYADVVRAMFNSGPSTHIGAQPATFTISVEGYGDYHVKGQTSVAEMLKLAPATCSTKLSQSNGYWRMLRSNPETGASMEVSVRRGEHGEHSPRVAAMLGKTAPSTVGRKASNVVQTKRSTKLKEALATAPAGTNKLKIMETIDD